MKAYNLKEYIYNHLLPSYIRTQDTYKNSKGEGILDRFLGICTEYFEKRFPEIDSYLDIIDLDKTPDIYLNLLWEYFGYIPYAYGILYTGETYNPEQIAVWMNNPKVFPRANTRKILKYAISLYKIRGTASFYEILGRFYGVNFIVKSLYSGDETENPLKDVTDLRYDVSPSQVPKPLVIALYQRVSSWYDSKTSAGCIKGGYYEGDCNSCSLLRAEVEIPHGIYEVLEADGRVAEVQEAFTRLITRYLPINARIQNDDPDGEMVKLIDSYTELRVTSPPSIVKP